MVEVKFSLQDRIMHLYEIKMSMHNNLYCRFRKMSSIIVAKTDTLHKKSLERPAMIRSDSGNMLSYYKKISYSKFHNRNNIRSHSNNSSVSFSEKAYEPPVYMEEDYEEEWDDD